MTDLEMTWKSNSSATNQTRYSIILIKIHGLFYFTVFSRNIKMLHYGQDAVGIQVWNFKNKKLKKRILACFENLACIEFVKIKIIFPNTLKLLKYELLQVTKPKFETVLFEIIKNYYYYHYYHC